jgi:predicted DNA-binding transcriptional regulator AlpA
MQKPKKFAEFLTVAELAERWGVKSESTIWKHAKEDPEFPPKYKLLPKMSGFKRSEVEAYEESRRKVART